MQLIAFGHQGKYEERRKRHLCVHWFIYVGASGDGDVFWFHKYLSGIFLKCHLNLKAMLAPKTFPLKFLVIFGILLGIFNSGKVCKNYFEG